MEKQYETPETNVRLAALKLMRHKMLMEMANNSMPRLYFEDVNEILIVAGLPVITPDEIHKKELDVIE